MKECNQLQFKTSCFLAALFILGCLTSGCQGKPEKEAAARRQVSGITTVPVSWSTVDEVYQATGTVRSDSVSIVASRAMGMVTSLFVREGDSVKAGQILLTIDDRDALSRAHAAQMAVESAAQNKSLAESTWQRYKNLYDDNALARQEMDQVETQKKIAQSEYQRAAALAREANAHLSFTRVTAPVSGRVTEKRIDAGSMVSPGLPLFVIEAAGGSYIESAVDAGWGDKIKPGLAVEALVETINQPITGTIREVFPAVDHLSRTFTIKVGLADVRPRSGLFARIKIPVGKKQAIIIPNQAIVRKGQLTGVYVVESDNIIIYRLIRAGAANGSQTEILSGLAENERIIVSGVERVADGDQLMRGNP